MPKPTIGRALWYWPSKQDTDGTQVTEANLIYSDGKQPCESRVAYVHSDTMVNLNVSDHHGRQHARTSVRLIRPDEDRPADGQAFAEWMPFQVKAEPQVNQVEQLLARVQALEDAAIPEAESQVRIGVPGDHVEQ